MLKACISVVVECGAKSGLPFYMIEEKDHELASFLKQAGYGKMGRVA